MKYFALLPVLLLMAAGPAAGGDIEIVDPWVRAVPPASPATAAFMVIVNKGAKPITLVAATSPISREVKPMITTKTADGLMGMEFVESFPVAAGKKRILEPGADHIMLMKLKEVPKAGTSVRMTLTFESGGKREEMSFLAPVR